MPRFLYSAMACAIDLGHHQRDVVLVAELRGVVDDDATGRGRLGRVLARHLAAGREQADLRALEIERGDIDHRDVPAAKLHAFAQRAVAGERQQLGHREIAFLEHADHGVAHEPGGSENRDPIAFLFLLAHD